MVKRGLIVIPACNEAAPLKSFFPRLKATLREMSQEADILVIDDGSSDDTSQVSRDLDCQVHRHEENEGCGKCIREGCQRCRDGSYDFFVSMDADGQHDPSFLPSLLGKLDQGYNFVTASRYHPQSQRISTPLDRDLLNVACLSIMHAITGWHISDPLTGFWVVDQTIVGFLASHLAQSRYGIRLEALIKMWYLLDPKPHLGEIPHPAVYAGSDGSGGYINRVYSPDREAERILRFTDHAGHILAALRDVTHERPHLREEIENRIFRWREAQGNGM